MTKKIYDLAVKTSTYTDRQTGKDKGRYQNVGAVMQSDDGSQFMMLSAWFNPAGIERKPGQESIMVSMFAPKSEQSRRNDSRQDRQPENNQQEPTQNNHYPDDFDDDLPF